MAQHITTSRHDSPLGTWEISMCTPHPRLAPLVAAIWYGAGSVRYQRDRILPSGQSQLLINLGPPQYRIDPGPPERRVAFRDVWYCPLQHTPIDTEAPHGQALLGIAFHAHGSFPWLGAALGEAGGHIAPLADLVGAGVLALRERLLNTVSLEVRFRLVQEWIIRRMAQQLPAHPAVLWAVGRIVASEGREPVDRLAAGAGYSRKHLAELFRRQVGMGPKELARVMRFRAALTLLQGRSAVPWAELANTCCYYDQSHLVNDFRNFAGMTPTAFVRQQQPDSQSIVLS
ncbi:MAG: helix-turn-helix domain-containing protein [Telluria sp.]